MIYKGFIISQHPASPTLLRVATQGQGGKIPKVLSGVFTSHFIVKREIDLYLDRPVTRRSKSNGEAASESAG